MYNSISSLILHKNIKIIFNFSNVLLSLKNYCLALNMNVRGSNFVLLVTSTSSKINRREKNCRRRGLTARVLCAAI